MKKIKEDILSLKHGEKYTITKSEYGIAEVWHINDIYVLFEIFLSWEVPTFIDTYSEDQIDMLLNNVSTWN